MPPKVSICIPTYNGAAFLKEAFDSVLGQDFRDFEVVISDDGSTDETLTLAQAFKGKTDFPVHIHHHSPPGIGANWNHTVLNSAGQYIKFLFQDDILEPTCLSEMVKTLDGNQDIGLVASKRFFLKDSSMSDASIDSWIKKYEDLQTEFSGDTRPFLRLDKDIFSMESFTASPLNKIGEPSVVMFRVELFKTLGPFREDLKQILDYEYWYRILKETNIAILPEKLVGFRIHAAQATNVNRDVDIPDYRIYDRILYDEYLSLLHPKVRKKLLKKFHPMYLLSDKVKLKIKLTAQKWLP